MKVDDVGVATCSVARAEPKDEPNPRPRAEPKPEPVADEGDIGDVRGPLGDVALAALGGGAKREEGSTTEKYDGALIDRGGGLAQYSAASG
jgi:hypothetical protein